MWQHDGRKSQNSMLHARMPPKPVTPTRQPTNPLLSSFPAPTQNNPGAATAAARNGEKIKNHMQTYPMRVAMSWTSRASPISAKIAPFSRCLVVRRCWCTAPTARSEGTGRRSGPAKRSDRITAWTGEYDTARQVRTTDRGRGLDKEKRRSGRGRTISCPYPYAYQDENVWVRNGVGEYETVRARAEK